MKLYLKSVKPCSEVVSYIQSLIVSITCQLYAVLSFFMPYMLYYLLYSVPHCKSPVSLTNWILHETFVEKGIAYLYFICYSLCSLEPHVNTL